MQFMDSINAGNRQLGNRAFLHWVAALRAARQESDTQVNAVQNLQGPGHPMAATAALQFGPKKHKKKGAAANQATSEAVAEAAPVTAPEPGESLSPAKPGGAPTPAEQKKKRKPRTQVALNTLRAAGVEAFAGYIEAEISEVELLHTLVQRLHRAEDLGDKNAGALAAVAERMRSLDRMTHPLAPPAPAPERVRVVEQAVVAPVKYLLTKREMDLFHCCARGNAKKLRDLFRYGATSPNTAEWQGTFLCHAAYNGHEAVVRELLCLPGIDVNLGQGTGATPLFLASQQGHIEVVKLLLAEPAIKINLSTRLGATPLHMAAQFRRTEVMKLLLEESNIQLDAREQEGATPLYYACHFSFPEIAEQLINRGADVNLPMDDDATPLCAAAASGAVEIVKKLLDTPGVKIDSQMDSGATALGIACNHGHKDIVRMLLMNGANPNITGNISGLSALHAACLKGDTAIVEMLLASGADIDLEANMKGRYTPCSLALLAGNQEAAALLQAYRSYKTEQAARLDRLSRCLQPQGQVPDDVPDRSSASTALPSLPHSTSEQPGQTAETSAASPAARGSQPMPATAPSPLEMTKQAMRQEVLGKLRCDNLEPLEGIRLLEAVNDTDNLDGLCVLYNRLAHIEREKERARRHVRPLLPACAGTSSAGGQVPGLKPQGQVAAAAPLFALAERTGLDADVVEREIKVHLGQAYHRFVSQAVNDMEFGRGKPTSGYPGLLHASAGIPGVGSCSVFYYPDVERHLNRIMGIGHHLDRETYQLDYATGALRGCRTIRLS